MLHTETVEPNTLSLLKELMQIPVFNQFSLVGGTALSLLYGHRISVDLDLFSNAPFSNEHIVTNLKTIFGNKFIMEEKPPQFGIFCFIDEIKIDIIQHPHPLMQPIKEIDGIRFFSTPDIIAMKVQAILGRGKKKDFWDIAELLQHFSIDDFIRFHKEKYSTQNILITVPQAITYFSDANESEDPISLKGQSWESIKQIISKKVREHLA